MNNTPTPETPIQILQNGQGRFRSDIEELFEKRSLEVLRAVHQVIQDHVALKKELAAVTEQRDDFKKELEIANLRLKGKRHPDDNGTMADGEIDVKAITEQRDRLAEALNKIQGAGLTAFDELTVTKSFTILIQIAVNRYIADLQSLNQPTEP